MKPDNDKTLLQSTTLGSATSSASPSNLNEMVSTLVQRWLAEGGRATVETSQTQGNQEHRIKVPAGSLADFCGHLLQSLPLYLTTMVAQDDRERSGYYRLYYLFGLDKSADFVRIETEIAEGKA